MTENVAPTALPCPDAQSQTYHDHVRGMLTAAARYDPQTRATGNTGSPTQLLLHTLDGVCEVLEWNNEGSAADEVACVWLSLLRWYRNTGRPWPKNAPFSLPRALDDQPGMSTFSPVDPAVQDALGTGEMQLLDPAPHPDQRGSGAVVRSAALGILPVAEDATIAQLCAKTTALTHNDRQTLASCVTFAGLVRCCLALAGTPSAVQDAGAWVRRWSQQLPVNGLMNIEGLSGVVQQALAIATAAEEAAKASGATLDAEDALRGSTGDEGQLAAMLLAAAHGPAVLGSTADSPLECDAAIDLLCRQWAKELGFRGA